MKLNKKSSKLFILFLILLPLFSIFIDPIEQIVIEEVESPKSTGYWTLGPIHIEATMGIGASIYTWEEAVAKDWCSGDGSLLNPYLLENITIDAGGTESAIIIENSNGVYFTIRNCTLMNTGTILMGNAGVKLDNTSNGTIEENKIHHIIKYGVYLSDSNYNVIHNNYMYNISHAGMRFDTSSYNNVTNNEIEEGGGSIYSQGFYISSSSNFNQFLYNNVSNMKDGIEILSGCHNNTISYSYVSSIQYDGIIINSDANNNTIVKNMVENTDNGIMVQGDGNVIYNNNMYNNAQNAYDDGQYNSWDNGVIGNYWDDYGGEDLDDDGIGDTLYNVPSTVGSKDNYPIWDDGFNGTAIHIDGTGISAPDWNWAKSRIWCTGEGSLSNPYLIKDITIDCGSIGSGIYIEHSTNEYFTIQNCTIMHAQASGGFAAIHLDFVQNGTLFKNNCSNNYAGMLVEHSEGINILENLLYHNIGQGIIIYQSNYNQISYNAQKGSRYYGLFIQGQSHNNTISNNNFTENTHGTYNGDGIYIAHNSDGNIVFENLLKDNDRGIHVEDGSDNNEIYYNTIHDNAEYGILIQRNSGMTINNIFYCNNIVNPLGVNAYDNGTSTEWDYLNQGNYWGDYSGVDNDDDGIGDNPYYFSGTGTAHDNFPIWDDGLNPTPVISLILPSETSFGATAPTINLTISDNDLVTGWYTINSSATKYFFKLAYGENNIVINQSIWTALSEGSLTLAFFANDTKGSIGELFISLTKELPNTPTPPSIPAGNYFMIFMGFSIISLLIIVSRRRKLIHS